MRRSPLRTGEPRKLAVPEVSGCCPRTTFRSEHGDHLTAMDVEIQVVPQGALTEAECPRAERQDHAGLFDGHAQ
jgi:hypothetical protein